MVIETRKITESRETQRNALDNEQRQTLALEQIADTLEALRILQRGGGECQYL